MTGLGPTGSTTSLESGTWNNNILGTIWYAVLYRTQRVPYKVIGIYGKVGTSSITRKEGRPTTIA